MRLLAARLLLLALLPACGSTSAAPASDGGADGGASPDGGASVSDVRGQRYCEILLAKVTGTQVHVDVYNTFGLNDCPDAAWTAVNAPAVAADAAVTTAILNGPRYWMMNGFEGSAFLEPTPRTLGGIAMRLAGAIDLPLASVGGLGRSPYTPTSIQRSTTVRFDAGQSVFELVGPDAKVYELQSYSVQKVAQTQADLPTLGTRLTLPTGWTFRTRTLAQTLRIATATTGGVATVVQDDLGNTYQLSAQ